MKISKNMYDFICSNINEYNFEIGGILGSSSDGVIINIVLDKPIEKQRCKFKYTPNVTYLNNIIEEWAKNNISFSGIFHTHFSGSRNLSSVDKDYIKLIMTVAKDYADYLFFPIFTLPDEVLTIYKCGIKENELIITVDNIEIV